MQAQAWTAQSPEVILRSVECGAAVRCDPSKERVGVIGRSLHDFGAWAIEVHDIQAHHAQSQQPAGDKRGKHSGFHALSIKETRS